MGLYGAFLLGLLGSWHCIGMCGPIAVALPTGLYGRGAIVLSRIWYNLGRVLTYASLGLVAGLFGDLIRLGGFQRVLSITLGIVILVAVLLPSRFTSKLIPSRLMFGLSNWIKRQWRKLFKRPTQRSLFVIGLLNGFLPCGLVYAAMAAASVEGGTGSAVMYMTAFGLGTFPLMMVTSLFGNAIPLTMRRKLNRLIPVGAIILAILLILRGLALGIPYISPGEMSHDQAMIDIKCH